MEKKKLEVKIHSLSAEYKFYIGFQLYSLSIYSYLFPNIEMAKLRFVKGISKQFVAIIQQNTANSNSLV